MSSQPGYDPQRLGLRGTISALVALGRLPFCLEVPLWTLFGCLISSQIFPCKSENGVGFDWWAALQCVLITMGTNVAINYGNEYSDWDLDRPSQVAAIEKDKAERRGEKGKASEENAKLMANTTRVIHDGTFPPWTALACSSACQFTLLALILYSRSSDLVINPSSHSPHSTPFKGLGIQLGLICTFLSHSYVGYPLRLHYHGFGELVSALFIAPVSFLFGLVGHYTAASGRTLSWSDLISTTAQTGFSLDTQLRTLITAFYFFEQARIFVMHINDIEGDIRGGKRTFVSRVGRTTAKNLYATFNIICLALFSLFGHSLLYKRGMFSRVSGQPLSPASRSIFNTVWLSGLSLVMAVSIVIWIVVYNALVADIPTNKAKPAVATGFLPSISMGTAIMLVSLQTMATPAVLSMVSLLAGYASARGQL